MYKSRFKHCSEIQTGDDKINLVKEYINDYTIISYGDTLAKINFLDLIVISVITFSVPFIGNLLLILFLIKVKELISSDKAIMRLNIVSGILLIFVAILILLNI